ncbi:CPCC family cysteine-rich protein [Citrobacter farmeri]
MSDYARCQICHWICDPAKSADSDLSEGRNSLSLSEARIA